MKSPIDSRQRFIDATADLLQRQGYHATGLKQIIAESGAPRGSLYFHFPGGKEELAAEALRSSGDAMRGALEAVVRAAQTPGAATRAVTNLLATQLEATGFQDGCPMATVVLEAATQYPTLQQICSASYEDWQGLITAFLTEAGLGEHDAAPLATLVLSAIEGALLLSRAHGDAAPLRTVGEQLGGLVEDALRR